MNRITWILASALAANGVLGFALIPVYAQNNATPAAPAQTDNQMNNMGGNQQNNTNNNAGAAVNNGSLADNTANTANSTGDTVRNKVDQAGAGTPTAENPAPDAKGIRKALAKVDAEALDKNNLDDLIDYFTTDAKDRIKKSATYDQNYGDKLDGRIEQINQAWKQKYGHEFKLKKPNDVLGDEFATIQQGVVGKDADLTSMVEQDASDSKIEDGRSIAIVTVKADHGLSELKVPLIHELPDSWRINVPGDLDAAKLRQNLTDHLTALGDHVADWPADEAAADRIVTHHVLMAVLNKPVEWNGSTNNGNDTGNMGGMNMGK